MTVATLGIAVESGQAVTADANLRRMAAASEQAEAAVSRLGGASQSASGGLRSIATSANAHAAATALATAKTQADTAALHANAAAAKMAGFQRRNLLFQLNDVGVSLASGMNPLMVAVQQGSQIATIYEGGVVPALKETAAMAGRAAVAFWPIGVAVGAVALAVGGMTDEINKSSKVSVSFGDTLKAVFQTVWDTFTNFIKPVTDSIGSLFSAAWVIATDATKIALNYVINSMVGAVKSIGALWNGLPAAIGEVSIKMANALVAGVEWAINRVSDALNGFLGKYNEGLAMMGQNPLPTFGQVNIPRATNPFEGASSSLDGSLGQIANENVDYVGGFYDDVKAHAIQNAIAGNKDLARSAAEAAKELERQAEAYDKIVLGANQFIEEQNLSVSALGMSAEAIAAARHEMDLMNKAANDNIDLTPQQTEALGALAQAMAAAEEAARVMTEAYEFGKGVFGDFFSDIKSGILEGQSLWESLGNAAAAALDKIADRALSMAADGIFDMIFGSIMGGITGGFGGNPLSLGAGGAGFLGGGSSSWGSLIPRFANGTPSAPGGLSWVGEEGPELVNLPRGAQVIPNGPSMAMASNQNAGPVFHISIDARGAERNAGPEIAKEVRKVLPDAIAAYERNNMRRTG